MMHYAQWNLSYVINDTKGFFHIRNYHGTQLDTPDLFSLRSFSSACEGLCLEND